MRLLTVLTILGGATLALSVSESVMVCYFRNTAAKRHGNLQFEIEDIDPFLCTHIMYAFVSIGENNQLVPKDPEIDLCDNGGKCGYDRFTGLKKSNPDLKAILALGNANDGPAKMSAMSADPQARKTFVASVLALLNAHNFDGFDNDWEYPTTNGGRPEDRENYILLMNELRDALHAEGKLLMAAVSAGKTTIDQAYDVPGLAAAADLIQIMAYSFHGEWNPYTHHHSILYQYPLDEGNMVYNNVDYAVQYYLSLGAPADKLVLGMATYGRCWVLDDPHQTGMYAPASIPEWFDSSLAYNEMCQHDMVSPWTVVNDPAMNEPYAYDLNFNNTWCGYDDAAALQTKTEYTRRYGLRGAMVWTIDYDDFLGLCHPRNYNLIRTITDNLAPTPDNKKTLD